MANVWWVNQKHKINGRLVNEVVWSPGATPEDPSQKSRWKKMWEAKVRDFIIHYSSASQQIVALSRVLTKATPARNPFPGDETWGDEGKQINVELTRLEVPINKTDIPIEVRKASSGKYQPFTASGETVRQGYFFPVPNILWSAILELAGVETTDDEVFQASSDELSVAETTDISRVAKGCAEQTLLLERLLGGRSEAQCGICGKLTPKRYLRAAHIKKRSTASERERRNPNIAMLACVLGCDQEFENGDIRVLNDGSIVLGNANDAFLQAQFGALIGCKAPAFNEENRRFFAARLASF